MTKGTAANTIRKIFLPVDGMDNRKNFEGWYEDGSLFCTVESKWEKETDKVEICGRTGGEIARIKPDHKAIKYAVRVDRWTYTLRTHLIFKHYFFDGMKWQMFGSISNGRANFRNEDTSKNDVHISIVKNFLDKGPCYEVVVKDVNKLRPAAAAVLAMMYKESYRGLSEGEGNEKLPLGRKIRHFFDDQGFTPEEVENMSLNKDYVSPMF